MKKLKAILITFLFSSMTFAGITCETPRGAKVLDIKMKSVSIQYPFKKTSNRSLASLSNIRTKIHNNGFTKVLFHKGEKHIIHIEDKKSFSQLDDYLIIRSKEGHEMTFPLNCRD